MELGYNTSHGRNALRPFFYLPVDVFIACECKDACKEFTVILNWFLITFSHSDQFPLFVKFLYWLRPGWYLPMFRKLKSVIIDCVKDRRQKAMAKQVNTIL